jgi:NADH dehydrogenase (ubiquinone) 1 alpha subcomplex subunit 2
LGVEKGIKLEGMTEPQISKVLEDLVKAGEAFKA